METKDISKRRVFVSYSSDMYDTAVLTCSELEKHNIETWIDRKSIPKGTDGWIPTIDDCILNSDLMIVLLNKESAKAPYVTYEWSFVLGVGKTVIGVRFEECDIHPRLKNTQLFMNEFMNGQRPWDMLANSILAIDIGEDFRQKTQEFKSISEDVYKKYTKQGVLSEDQMISNED